MKGGFVGEKFGGLVVVRGAGKDGRGGQKEGTGG